MQYYTNSTSGVTFNGTDTFTITREGLYYLDVTLNIVSTTANSTFGISINGGDIVAPSSNASTTGQISVIRVGNYSVNDTIRIVSKSPNSVDLKNGTSVLGSAGHLALFRFADARIT